MKFINTLREGERLSGIYLCKHKQAAVTKNGKPYENVILQDKTGTLDGKIWDPNSQGIDDFDSLDYIDVVGDVTSFQGSLQVLSLIHILIRLISTRKKMGICMQFTEHQQKVCAVFR